ncbi:MAG TPA: hypothetical protein VFZ65_18945 [Planctomycetota bacterium]|nr:hypothetical protein [Planctomycetota bacterium]
MRVRAVLVPCCLWWCGAAPAQAQTAHAGPDPYTNGDPAAIAKAGYVSYGPFPFGARHTTKDVEELLGTEPLIWIETPHFRLGCALPAVELTKGQEWSVEWLASVQRELKALRSVLPKVRVQSKQLDPWLRAHLFAHRLEALYAEVRGNLGFVEPTDDEVEAHRAGTGHGRYLGMDEKFAVLLLQRSSSHARYTRAFQGQEMADPIRYDDAVFGSMYWGGSEETADGLLRSDLAMHTHVVFNVAHNLYSGCLGSARELPPWLATGLSHWHARRVSPRFPVYDRRDDRDHDPRSLFWRWDERVAGMAKNGTFEPMATFVERVNAGGYRIEQHMQCWSLVDFLLSTRADATFRFVRLAKQSGLSRQHGFEQAFGCTYEEIDAAWLRWLRGK